MKLTAGQEAVEARMGMLWDADWSPLFAQLNASNINECDRGGRAVLSQAICSLQVDAAKIKRLLDLGADVNAADKKPRFTPLHCAVQERQLEIARLLIQRGANVNARDGYGNTPLWRAVFGNDDTSELVRLLVQAGADPDIKNESAVSPRDLAARFQKSELLAVFD